MPVALVCCVVVDIVIGESVIKSVRPLESTKLNAPGDIDENIVSKISNESFLSEDIELSRHEVKSGSFMSKRLPLFEPGVKLESGAVEVEDIPLNPFILVGDWF